MQWPSSVGEVTSHNVTKHRGWGEDGIDYWRANAILSYYVAGRTYSKTIRPRTRVGFSMYKSWDTDGDRDRKLREARRNYPLGTKIPIYFSPNNPKRSVFEQGVHSNQVAYPVLALIVYLIQIFYPNLMLSSDLVPSSMLITIIIFSSSFFLILFNFILFLYGYNQTSLQKRRSSTRERGAREERVER